MSKAGGKKCYKKTVSLFSMVLQYNRRTEDSRGFSCFRNGLKGDNSSTFIPSSVILGQILSTVQIPASEGLLTTSEACP